MRWQRVSLILAVAVVAAAASSGCAALTGLDQIQEEDCAPTCGEGEPGTDAAPGHDAADPRPDATPAADAGDAGTGPETEEDARSEVGPLGAPDAADTGSALDATGATDARDATSGPDGSEGGGGDAADGGATTDGGDAEGTLDASDAGHDAPADAPPEAGDSGSVCALANLVIAEVRSRGAGGAADEFVVLFNPTSAAVTLDATWTLLSRSSTASSFASRWTGAGASIPAHGFFLVAGSAYSQSPAADDHLSTGITDATALRLERAGNVVDTVCYKYDAATLATLEGAAYACEGTPADNLPHDDSASAASDVDQSLRRAHCVDTGDNSADFAKQAPATPRGTTSPPEP